MPKEGKQVLNIKKSSVLLFIVLCSCSKSEVLCVSFVELCIFFFAKRVARLLEGTLAVSLLRQGKRMKEGVADTNYIEPSDRNNSEGVTIAPFFFFFFYVSTSFMEVSIVAVANLLPSSMPFFFPLVLLGHHLHVGAAAGGVRRRVVGAHRLLHNLIEPKVL